MLNGSEVSKGIGIGIAKVISSPENSAMSNDDFVKEVSGTKPGAVLVASHLTPFMVGVLKDYSIAGLVCETGGMASHSALAAKSMGIPAVYDVADATREINEGDTVIVDGISGYVYERPDPEIVAGFSAKRKKYLADLEELKKYRNLKTAMADGTEAAIMCNTSDIISVMHAIDEGGEGIGLFRTEILMSGEGRVPDEEEQTRVYSRIATAMRGKEVVIRTLDIGGDKNIPFLELEKEENPFLGYRGVRYSLGHRDIFATQLRAILRASAHGNLSIMIPMITCVDEMRSIKSLIHEIKTDLRDEGYEFNDDIKVGATIETPSAAIIADMLARECDFFSIGTNDLIQYVMSADRGNSRVAYLQSVTQPSILRMIKQTIDAAKSAGIDASMCGEAASDPEVIPIFAGFGCRKFSVNPLSVTEVRRTLSEWSAEDAEKLAADVMAIPTDQEVRDYIHKIYKDRKS
jgi:phosphotransferase system enzyme I (PtsI)